MRQLLPNPVKPLVFLQSFSGTKRDQLHPACAGFPQLPDPMEPEKELQLPSPPACGMKSTTYLPTHLL